MRQPACAVDLLRVTQPDRKRHSENDGSREHRQPGGVDGVLDYARAISPANASGPPNEAIATQVNTHRAIGRCSETGSRRAPTNRLTPSNVLVPARTRTPTERCNTHTI
jgi:hypothetical protein